LVDGGGFFFPAKSPKNFKKTAFFLKTDSRFDILESGKPRDEERSDRRLSPPLHFTESTQTACFASSPQSLKTRPFRDV
jgi:hypothetical protein